MTGGRPDERLLEVAVGAVVVVLLELDVDCPSRSDRTDTRELEAVRGGSAGTSGRC